LIAAIRVAAPAKLNLYLQVLGRRADGYHLLDSLVAFASVHDTLTAAPAEDLSLAFCGPFGPRLAREGDNLVLRAVRLLAHELALEPKAALTLDKRLPLASGIGGGSADAAAALTALPRLWNRSLAASELARLALALGADVPVCLFGRAAFVGGIGEELAAAPPLPQAALVLVNPGMALATAEVFRAREAPFSAPARFERAPRDAAELAMLLAERRNDLTAAAARLCPAIAEVLAALGAQPGCLLARMSGSGATCFGLFGQAADAAAAAQALARPDWWVVPAQLVTDAATLAPAPVGSP